MLCIVIARSVAKWQAFFENLEIKLDCFAALAMTTSALSQIGSFALVNELTAILGILKFNSAA